MTDPHSKKSDAVTVSIDIGALHEGHPLIRAHDWRSPLVRRLLGNENYADGQASLIDSYRPPSGAEANGTVPVHWSGLKTDFDQCMRTYQAPVLTEFAALGLACILLTRHTALQISEVTRRGERVDYWIGDDQTPRKLVLEVGGEQTGSLEGLAAAKAAQLRRNPWGRDGFICVAVFEQAIARLWYCAPGSAS